MWGPGLAAMSRWSGHLWHTCGEYLMRWRSDYDAFALSCHSCDVTSDPFLPLTRRLSIPKCGPSAISAAGDQTQPFAPKPKNVRFRRQRSIAIDEADRRNRATSRGAAARSVVSSSYSCRFGSRLGDGKAAMSRQAACKLKITRFCPPPRLRSQGPPPCLREGRGGARLRAPRWSAA
jgi:hypothetical protein